MVISIKKDGVQENVWRSKLKQVSFNFFLFFRQVNKVWKEEWKYWPHVDFLLLLSHSLSPSQVSLSPPSGKIGAVRSITKFDSSFLLWDELLVRERTSLSFLHPLLLISFHPHLFPSSVYMSRWWWPSWGLRQPDPGPLSLSLTFLVLLLSTSCSWLSHGSCLHVLCDHLKTSTSLEVSLWILSFSLLSNANNILDQDRSIQLEQNHVLPGTWFLFVAGT